VVTGIALFIMLLLVRNFFGVISVLFNGGIVVLVLWYGSVKLQIIAAYALGWFLLLPGVRFGAVHGSKGGPEVTSSSDSLHSRCISVPVASSY